MFVRARHADWVHLGVHRLDAVECRRWDPFGIDLQFAAPAFLRMQHAARRRALDLPPHHPLCTRRTNLMSFAGQICGVATNCLERSRDVHVARRPVLAM